VTCKILRRLIFDQILSVVGRPWVLCWNLAFLVFVLPLLLSV